MMCKIFGYSRDAYYKHSKKRLQASQRSSQVLELVETVREEQPRIGTRKLLREITPELLERGDSIGRDKLFELLRKENKLIKPKKSFSKTTYSQHSYAVAPNRIKELTIQRVNEVWVSDITYLRLTGGRFAYLFLVTDAYSRRIMGYHVRKDLSHLGAVYALEHALGEAPDAGPVIHHSDRGCQYCCHEFIGYLGMKEMFSSMTDESHCYQNAIAERVNGILKDEFNLDAVFDSLENTRSVVEHSVFVYNNKRLHWSLGLQTPEKVYHANI